MTSDTIASLLLTFAFCGTAFGAVPAAHQTASYQSIPGSSTREIFVKNCASCHGRDGTSNTPLGKAMNAANLTSAKIQRQSNATLAHFISAGDGRMPAFNHVLSKQQIAGQVQYIRSLERNK
jgi:mono/diheme cytochrome c family protein